VTRFFLVFFLFFFRQNRYSVATRFFAPYKSLVMLKKDGQLQTNEYSYFMKQFATKQPMKRLFATQA
jgi:hypothetical protein